MSEAPVPSDALIQLVIAALEHALSTIDEGGVPMVPFAMIEREGKFGMKMFPGDDQGESIGAAREEATQLVEAGTATAIAFDGFIGEGESESDAVFVQAADAASGPTFTFCQRYTLQGDAQKVELVGEPGYIRFEDGLFAE